MAVEILIEIFLLIVALIALAFSSKLILESAEKLAIYFRISKLAIGFILISLLTSLPETSIAIFSSLSQNNNLSLGNLLGANVVNISLVFAVLLIISKTEIIFERKRLEQIFLYLLISLIPILLFIDDYLSTGDGLILLVLYLIFIKQVIDSKERTFGTNHMDKQKAAKEFLILLVSVLIVFICSDFVVEIAVEIAERLNIFKSFLGGTLIALNTCLPELAITLAATRRSQLDIAIGNLIGSNVVNITFILALNILINPFVPNLQIALTIFAFIFLISSFIIYKLLISRRLNKSDGIILLAMYGIYLLIMTSIQIVAR